ncbi:NUDIX hydrolase [Persicobacter sp. CCB-QB2]|uniref:NUDIX hydrolase n=1 Tax=Persicobacter sp. CCB-QB2 TaxID=1561025 RepID=UPI0006A98A6B|nr:NUDIX domain-containing protein [Persicobacter sp. CCB-QB2]
MKVFINDRVIRLIDRDKEVSHRSYQHRLDGKKEHLSPELEGNVLIKNADLVHLAQSIEISRRKDQGNWKALTMQFKDLERAKTFFKEQFNIVEAAGGLVTNGKDQKLMIFRLGKWDLPKGKLDKGEKPAAAGLREVEEECNIKAKLGDKICHTWHTYVYKGKNVLKKTYWYEMTCLSDKHMRPQIEEDIHEVRWMSDYEVQAALSNTFPSIKLVWKKFLKKQWA